MVLSEYFDGETLDALCSVHSLQLTNRHELTPLVINIFPSWVSVTVREKVLGIWIWEQLLFAIPLKEEEFGIPGFSCVGGGGREGGKEGGFAVSFNDIWMESKYKSS